MRVPGAGDPVPVRTYSLSGDPDGGSYRISVKREAHGLVSAYLHTHLQPGDRIEVAAPRGDFVLDEGPGPVLLVSAGIGVTPLLAMLHRLASEHSTREVWWIHTTHDADTHAFAAEAADLLGRLPAAHSLVYYTTPAQPPAPDSGVRIGRLTADGDRGPGPAHGRDRLRLWPGVVHGRRRRRARGRRHRPGRDPHRAVRVAIRDQPRRRPAEAPAPHQPPGSPGTGPSVTFARSGLATSWSDRYASVLELAEACDVPTQWSCRTGVCHTCVTAVLSGEASYDVPPLEEPGGDELLICSATPDQRPRGRPLRDGLATAP